MHTGLDQEDVFGVLAVGTARRERGLQDQEKVTGREG